MNKCSKKELMAIGKDAGLKYMTSMKKQELIDCVEEVLSGSYTGAYDKFLRRTVPSMNAMKRYEKLEWVKDPKEREEVLKRREEEQKMKLQEERERRLRREKLTQRRLLREKQKAEEDQKQDGS
jgi:hypothetical protein